MIHNMKELKTEYKTRRKGLKLMKKLGLNFHFIGWMDSYHIKNCTKAEMLGELKRVRGSGTEMKFVRYWLNGCGNLAVSYRIEKLELVFHLTDATNALEKLSKGKRQITEKTETSKVVTCKVAL